MKRFIPPLIFVVTVALWIASPAKAHAVLVRSVPNAGEALLEPPKEIILEFSEELDPVSSKVNLFDGNGRVVVPGPGTVEPGDPHVLRLQVNLLPEGVYSAVWRARSAVDGHVTNGSVGFSIGESSPLASLLPPPGTPDPATTTHSIAEALARWLSYLSAALAVGSVAFGFLIWRPAYLQDVNKSPASDEAMRRLMRRLTLISVIVLAAATLAFVITLAVHASEASSGTTLGTFFSLVFAGRIGVLMAARLVLIAIIGWVVWRLPSPGTGSSKSWWLILALGGLLLFTFSLQGHGAARGSVPDVVVIWLHLAATTLWLGGLPMLFIALRQGGIPAATLVPRFSQAALFSVGILIVTGIYNAITYVGLPQAFITTTYGRALIIKTAIFALLLSLGAVNLFVLSPRLRERRKNAPNTLGRTVRIEMALGIVLLLAVGVLSSVAPAFEALHESQAQGMIETDRVDGVDMLVRVAPAEAGDNEIAVEFTDKRPGANSLAPEVLLRLTSMSMDMGTQQVQATSVDGFRYIARGSYFPMTGPWELEVIIRRPGFNDVRQTFELEIQDK